MRKIWIFVLPTADYRRVIVSYSLLV